MRRSHATVAVFAVTVAFAATLLGGCASAPEASETAAATSDFLPCAVADLTGFDDRDFNQLTFEGVQAAAEEIGVEAKGAEPAAEDQYESSINSLIDEDCAFIVTVGFALANATRDVAEIATDVDFALIDSVVTDDDFNVVELENVKPVLFDTAQASALAGYLAAGVSKTGIVGVYGGMPFPSVTVFLDGFADGVAHYNEVHDASVTLLGWDKETQNGLFVGSFDDQLAARTITEGLLDQNADVIMPVAGTLVEASGAAIRERGGEQALVGVNSDSYDAVPALAGLFLTSVMKNLTTAAHEVTLEAADGTFSNKPYVGTLDNGGVAIAPLHDWESLVDPALWEEVQQLQEDIISGDFVVESVSSPRP
jgi:basic membrane protein A